MSSPFRVVRPGERVADDSGRFGDDNGGDPPAGGNDMSERISRLETQMDRLQSEVTDLRIGVARIDERLGHMPTSAAMLTYFGVALVAILAGAWWVVQQYLAPILAAAG